MNRFDVIASGYPSLDHILKIEPTPKIGHTSLITNHNFNQTHFGGCNVNVSVNLGRLGLNVAPILRVGTDELTTEFLNYLTKNGVSLKAVRQFSNLKTSTTYLVETPDNEHITLFYPGAMHASHFEPYEDEWFKEAKCALMTVASVKDNEEFLQKVKQYDIPLFLGMKMDGDAFPKPFLKSCLAETHTLFANESESKCILDLLGEESVLDLFSSLPKCKQIIVTKGCQGSIAYVRNNNQIEEYKASIVKTTNVMDTVGSGDAFIAGFIYGYLNQQSIETSLRYGSTLASFVIEGIGSTSNSPTQKQLENRFHDYYKE